LTSSSTRRTGCQRPSNRVPRWPVDAIAGMPPVKIGVKELFFDQESDILLVNVLHPIISRLFVVHRR
jgi:hypothetical protein